MYDIRKVTPWLVTNFRITFYERGSSRLTLEARNSKRIHIELTPEQTFQLIKDTEDALS